MKTSYFFRIRNGHDRDNERAEMSSWLPPFLPLEEGAVIETLDIFHSNTHYLPFSALDKHKTNDLTAKAKSTRC